MVKDCKLDTFLNDYQKDEEIIRFCARGINIDQYPLKKSLLTSFEDSSLEAMFSGRHKVNYNR